MDQALQLTALKSKDTSTFHKLLLFCPFDPLWFSGVVEKEAAGPTPHKGDVVLRRLGSWVLDVYDGCYKTVRHSVVVVLVLRTLVDCRARRRYHITNGFWSQVDDKARSGFGGQYSSRDLPAARAIFLNGSTVNVIGVVERNTKNVRHM